MLGAKNFRFSPCLLLTAFAAVAPAEATDTNLLICTQN